MTDAPPPRATRPQRLTRPRVQALVVAVIALLIVGIALPAIQKVRVRRDQTASINNLRQIGLANQNFHDVYLRFPGNGIGSGADLIDFADPTAAPYHAQILPYFEAAPLPRPADATPEHPVVYRVFLEPARGRAGYIDGKPVTDYAVNLLVLYGGNLASLTQNDLRRGTLNLSNIIDGSSSTVLAAQKAMNPADYNSTGPPADDTFFHPSAGGSNWATTRYTMGVTLPNALPPIPLPVTSLLQPQVVADADTPPGAATDFYGGPYREGLLYLFCDGHAALFKRDWLMQTFPSEGCNSVDYPGSSMNHFRMILTPQCDPQTRWGD